MRIILQHGEVFVGEFLDRSGQSLVAGPEVGGGEMFQSSEHLPDLKSLIALSARVSNLPARASFLI